MQTIKFLSMDTVAEGTLLCNFAKPEGFNYRAGQSIDLTLPTGGMHAYSLVSAPHEDFLAIATRMRESVFKKALGALEPGSEVQIDGPFGSFFLHDNTARPAVILAGGIGVTPFFSIVKDATERALQHTMYMFYSNRRPEDAAFLSELRVLEGSNQKFALIPTMTEVEKSAKPWTGEMGYITAEMIKKYVPTSAQPVYYMAGPQAMVTAMRNLLTTVGVSNDDIRFEEFTGY